MTRLKTSDIAGIIPCLAQFDAVLERKTGKNLFGVACHGIRADKNKASRIVPKLTIAVIPFTSGLGIISNFCLTVKEIVAHLGFLSFVTHETDASGLAEAYEKSADIIMMADDNRYIALQLRQMKIVDNGWATGNAFASALDLMAEGLKDKNVLVTGCGPVGQAAIQTLMDFGANVSVYDPDVEKTRAFPLDLLKLYKKRLMIESSLKDSVGKYRYIIEASTAKDIIDIDDISQKTIITAPGVPLGVTDRAVKKLGSQILHDTLQLGTATMALKAAMF